MGNRGSRLRAVLAAGALGLALAAPAAAQPPLFATPEAALEAFQAALATGDSGALTRVFDPADLPAITGSDPAIAREDFARTAAAAKQAAVLRPDGPDRMIVTLGRIAWPMPAPLVRGPDGWYFDTQAGIEELINRRIGRNELAAIRVLRAFVRAQEQYFGEDHDGDRVHEYAQRSISTPGTRDGLYWPTAGGERPSPLGPLAIEDASYLEGKKQGDAYRGYYFRILTRQGPNAPGGEHDYVINGNMIAGFAALAWPAEYGVTGIMTFLVGPEGLVLERDLGEDTATLVAAVDRFDPDASWRASPD